MEKPNRLSEALDLSFRESRFFWKNFPGEEKFHASPPDGSYLLAFLRLWTVFYSSLMWTSEG